MKKFNSYLKGGLAAVLLLASFGTAGAALTAGSEYSFSCDYTLVDHSYEQYLLGGEFNFTVVSANAWNAKISNFGIVSDETLTFDNNGDGTYNLPQYALMSEQLAFSDAEGDYPFSYNYPLNDGSGDYGVRPDIYVTFTTDDSGNITIPDFTLVKYNMGNNTAEVVARYNNVRVVDPNRTMPDLDQLAGQYSFSSTLTIDNAYYKEFFKSDFDFTARIDQVNGKLYLYDFITNEEQGIAIQNYDQETGLITFPNVSWFNEDAYEYMYIGDANGTIVDENYDYYQLQITIDSEGRLSIPDFTVVVSEFGSDETVAKYTAINAFKTDGFAKVDKPSFPGSYTVTGTKLNYTGRDSDPIETTETFKLTIGEDGSLLAIAGYNLEALVEAGVDKGFMETYMWTLPNANAYVEKIGVNGGKADLKISTGSTTEYQSGNELTLFYNEGAFTLNDFSIWEVVTQTTPGADDDTPGKTEEVGTLLYAWTDLQVVPGWEEVIVPEIWPVGVHEFDWYKTDYSNPENPVTTKEKMLFSINEDLQYVQIGNMNVDNELIDEGYNKGEVSEDGTVWTIELTNFNNIIEMDYATGAGIRVSGNLNPAAEGPDTQSELKLTYNAETEEWNLTDFTIWEKKVENTGGDTDEEGNVGGETNMTWKLLALWSSEGTVTEVPSDDIEGTLTPADYEIEYVKGATGTETLYLPILLDVTSGPMTYMGFQFEIQLPEFLSFAEENPVELAIPLPGTVSSSLKKGTEDTYIVVAYMDANNGKGYTATGEVMTLKLDYDLADLAEYAPEEKNGSAEYPATIISNTVFFSTVDGQDIRGIEGKAGTITIVDETVYTESVTIESVELAAPSYATNEEGEEITQVKQITEGEELTITVVVEPADSDEGVEWTVKVDGEPVDNPGEYIIENEDGTYTFVWGGDELAEGESADVTITATSGDVQSEPYEFTVRGILLGDSNDSEKVTVADVVTTANYVAAITSARFDFPNANVILVPNQEDEQVINIQDVTATVQIVLGTWGGNRDENVVAAARRNVRNFNTNDALVASNFKAGETTIGVDLVNSYSYTGIQAVVEIPEGMTVSNVTAGPRAAGHQLIYNVLENGNVAVVIFSTSNASFADVEGSLFDINVMASEESRGIRINEIMAADANCNGYTLSFDGGMNETGTTGIDGIDADDSNARYFTVDGIEVFNPEKGQILIRVENGKSVKVVK